MKETNSSINITELNQKIEKMNKGVKKSFKITLAGVALFGLSLLVGLPIGLIANISWLTIASCVGLGVGAVAQAGGCCLSLSKNNKWYDLIVEREVLKRKIEMEKQSNLLVEKTDRVSKNPIRQSCIKTTSKIVDEELEEDVLTTD